MKKLKLLLFTCIIFAMGLFCGCGPRTIDLNKYVKADLSGYNTIGTIRCEWDKEALRKDFDGKLKFNSDTNKEAALMEAFGEDPINYIDNYAKFRFTATDNLSNGDKVYLQWKCEDEKFEKIFNCKLKYSEMEFEVDGLEEIETFDPFQYLEVKEEGIAPFGEVSLTVNHEKEFMQFIDFNVYDTNDKKEILSHEVWHKISHIKNGDTYYIMASLSCSTEQFAKKYGMIPSPLVKEKTVTDLQTYCDSESEIPDEFVKQLSDRGEEIVRNYINSNWSKPENLKKLTCIGNYYLYPKNPPSFPENKIYLMYKIEALNPEPEQIVEFYYYVEFENLTESPSGEFFVDMNTYTEPEDAGWFTSGDTFKVGDYTYKGFTSLDAFKENVILSSGYIYRQNITE